MISSYSIGFLGGGRITRILLQAYGIKIAEHKSIWVYDTNSDVLTHLKQKFPSINIAEDFKQVFQQSIVFIALHPPAIIDYLELDKQVIRPDAIIVSLAPKINIEKFTSKFSHNRIVRMIPNATSYINQGYNPLAFSDGFLPKAKAELLSLFRVLGTTIEVEESKLEAYAIISAMLPTYFWFQWNELEKLGIQMGLTNEESRSAIKNTMIAAVDLMYDSELEPMEVEDLIPVKPIGEDEDQVIDIYRTRLMNLYRKIST